MKKIISVIIGVMVVISMSFGYSFSKDYCLKLGGVYVDEIGTCLINGYSKTENTSFPEIYQYNGYGKCFDGIACLQYEKPFPSGQKYDLKIIEKPVDKSKEEIKKEAESKLKGHNFKVKGVWVQYDNEPFGWIFISNSGKVYKLMPSMLNFVPVDVKVKMKNGVVEVQ